MLNFNNSIKILVIFARLKIPLSRNAQIVLLRVLNSKYPKISLSTISIYFKSLKMFVLKTRIWVRVFYSKKIRCLYKHKLYFLLIQIISDIIWNNTALKGEGEKLL